MAELDSIVKINLYRGSTPVETASFSIPLILSTFVNFPERTRTYTSIDAVGEDFDSSDPVYQVAQALYGQTGVLGAPIRTLVIGRRQVDGAVGSVVTVANNANYSITVSDGITTTTYTVTSDASATATEIVTALAAAYNASPVAGINITDNLDGTFDVEPATAGADWSITTSANLTVGSFLATESWTDALDAVNNDNSTWYALFTDEHDPVVVEELSDAIATRRRIFGTSSQDPAVLASGSTTDIAAVLSAKSAGRTYGVWTPLADTEFPEAAWAGSQLGVTPGGNDWDFKRANGITVSKITDAQRTVLRNKNMNMYTRVAGVNIFQDGDMFDGTPIDIIIGEDWLYARLQEGVYFRLINSLKIPMTNTGLTIIENEIRAVLSQAEQNGLIDRGWSVTVPDVLSIPENLRAQRIAGVFRFDARLQGAVRSVDIAGYLTV